jgi:hypothetical protein
MFRRCFIQSTLAIAAASLVTPLWAQFACVANEFSNNVSGYTIDPISGALTAISGSPFPAGTQPRSVTVSRRRFAGTPGTANCHGTSVSALEQQFGTLDAAAAALGFPSVQALQDAIRAFCQ